MLSSNSITQISRAASGLRGRLLLRATALAAFASAASVFAASEGSVSTGEVWDFPQPHPVGDRVNVTTRVVLRTVVGVYGPPPPPAVVGVLPGTVVELATPLSDGEPAEVLWFKDGERLAASGRTLRIAAASESDNGVYTAQLKREVEPAVLFASLLERIRLHVDDAADGKLINVSTRATISPANSSLTVGFVVDSESSPGQAATHLLIRAVGPGLVDFGVTNPLAQPVVTLFDGGGRRIAWPEVYIPEWNPYELAHAVAPRVGASPLRRDRRDFAILQTLPAGIYTAQITSGDRGQGDVVFEVYEVPLSAIPALGEDTAVDPAPTGDASARLPGHPTRRLAP